MGKQSRSETKKRHAGRRTLVQAAAALLMNLNLKGFWTGRIYTGATKNACVPVLNCYSCPGALGSCPIGAMQAVATDRKFSVSFYVVGFLALIGTAVGRLFCGWICPFGWFQDLLYKIPVRKRTIRGKAGRILGLGKYVMLFGLVLLLPAVLADDFGIGSPLFCKLVCPAGTLEAGIPLLLTNPPLRASIGWLFNWKLLVLAVIVTGSLFTLRPFCRFVCPLGAFYALFQRFSLYRMRVDPNLCTRCDACSRACGLDLRPQDDPNHPDCIRCGVCIKACPTGALTAGFRPPALTDTPYVHGQDNPPVD
jgi:polyferredoxin